MGFLATSTVANINPTQIAEATASGDWATETVELQRFRLQPGEIMVLFDSGIRFTEARVSVNLLCQAGAPVGEVQSAYSEGSGGIFGGNTGQIIIDSVADNTGHTSAGSTCVFTDHISVPLGTNNLGNLIILNNTSG